MEEEEAIFPCYGVKIYYKQPGGGFLVVTYDYPDGIEKPYIPFLDGDEEGVK